MKTQLLIISLVSAISTSMVISADVAHTTNTKAITTTIVFKTDGTYAIGDKVYDLAKLSVKIKQLAVSNPESSLVLKTPKESNYERVLVVLDAARTAGLWNIGLATPPQN
jgi:biopolymer transport protein ExbD